MAPEPFASLHLALTPGLAIVFSSRTLVPEAIGSVLEMQSVSPLLGRFLVVVVVVCFPPEYLVQEAPAKGHLP